MTVEPMVERNGGVWVVLMKDLNTVVVGAVCETHERAIKVAQSLKGTVDGPWWIKPSSEYR